jgi:hypothetical protein
MRAAGGSRDNNQGGNTTKWILMLFVLAGSCSAFGQTAVPLKVYISADMEGVARVQWLSGW